MSPQRYLATVTIVGLVALNACGSSGGNSSFSNDLQSACRPLSRDLGNDDAPTSMSGVAAAATKASSIYEQAVAAMAKLKAPSANRSDFDDLRSNVQDQLDLLDSIGAASTKHDDTTVRAKVDKITALQVKATKLATSLGARACSFEPPLLPLASTTGPTTPTGSTSSTAPPDTAPPDTSPPDTSPPDTGAPTTRPRPTTPPATQPPTTVATTPPASAADKTIVHLADRITPQGNYSFRDADDSRVTIIHSLIDLSSVVAAQAGQVFGVDVYDANGSDIARVFGFIPTADALAPGSFDDVLPQVSSGNPTTPRTIDGQSGVTFVNGSNTFFLTADHKTLLLVVAPNADQLAFAATFFIDSVIAS